MGISENALQSFTLEDQGRKFKLFWEFDQAATITPTPVPILKVGTVNLGNDVYLLRAGTPIDENGVVANNGNAKFLVSEDFYFYDNRADQAKVVPLISAGYVNRTMAEAAWGYTYTPEAVAALAAVHIYLVYTFEYGGGGGTDVVANPTLSGNEDPLNGLQVGDTKYIVNSSNVLFVKFTKSGDGNFCDHTYQELVDAYDAGKEIVAYLEVGGSRSVEDCEAYPIALSKLTFVGVKAVPTSYFTGNLLCETLTLDAQVSYRELRSYDVLIDSEEAVHISFRALYVSDYYVAYVIENEGRRVLNRTWQELFDGHYQTIERTVSEDSKEVYHISRIQKDSSGGTDVYEVITEGGETATSYIFLTDSTDGYPYYDANPKKAETKGQGS